MTAMNHNHFHVAGTKRRDFPSLLKEVQEYISGKYTVMISQDKHQQKEQLMLFISKYLRDSSLMVDGMEFDELVERLYQEMAEYSILTRFLFSTGVEEININSWKDVKVTWSTGKTETLTEHFASPQHALDVIRRLLHKSGMILDFARPVVRGHLANNIRITAFGPPITDEEKGVAASIRMINPQKLAREDFIQSGTASPEILEFLSMVMRYGVSMCITGATGSGKTTLMSWVLSTIPDDKRVFSIENGVREFDLSRIGQDDRVLNNVVHTVTRSSEDPKQNVDQEMLLEYALTANPDIICVGEMKSAEAFAAQEAARTGHAVVTTIHANSCEATYGRMMTLCKVKYDISDNTLYNLVTEAFPIVAFVKRLEDGTRRVMEIIECEVLPDGKRINHPLFRFNVQGVDRKNGNTSIHGGFQKMSDLSETMQKRLRENGMPKEVLAKLQLRQDEVRKKVPS